MKKPTKPRKPNKPTEVSKRFRGPNKRLSQTRTILTGYCDSLQAEIDLEYKNVKFSKDIKLSDISMLAGWGDPELCINVPMTYDNPQLTCPMYCEETRKEFHKKNYEKYLKALDRYESKMEEYGPKLAKYTEDLAKYIEFAEGRAKEKRKKQFDQLKQEFDKE